MPELPEVEAVCRKLRDEALGRTIQSVQVLRPGTVSPQSEQHLIGLIANQRIEAIDRRAKHILIRLANQHTVHIHLRMTGNLYTVPDARFHPANARVIFHLPNHGGILFTDPRCLGRIQVRTGQEIETLLADIGPEPLSDDFTPQWFHREAKSSRQPAKLFLLDQTRIAGLGNIYAAEALFRAGVHPERVISRLTRPRLVRLHGAIVEVLKDAVQSACNAYSGPGHFGEAEDFLCCVYDREDLPCQNCSRPIRRIPQGGRSTYFCPGCQK